MLAKYFSEFTPECALDKLERESRLPRSCLTSKLNSIFGQHTNQMSKQKSLAAWLKPASADALNVPKPVAAPKRKRTSTESTFDNPDSENEAIPKKKKATKPKAKSKDAPKKAPEGQKKPPNSYTRR